MTWNVRGLNDRVKRSLVCQFLKRHAPDIVCLQETHLTGSKVLSLRKPWVGWSYHSTFTNSSRGVSVLIRKNLHFKLIEQVLDDDGRYVILRCSIMFRPLILISVYVPPPANLTIIKEVLLYYTSFPGIPTVLLGDFNMLLCPDLDRFRPAGEALRPSGTLTPLAQLMLDTHMVDAWRHLHPSDSVFTCFSSTHMSLSKIDHMLVSNDLVPYVAAASYASRSVSDHSPGILDVEWGLRPTLKGWRLNPFWLTLFPEEHDIFMAVPSYFEVNRDTADPLIVWDAYKAYMRGYLTTAINDIKRNTSRALERLEAEERAAELKYIADPSDELRVVWLRAQSAVKDSHVEAAQRQVFFWRQKVFEHGDKCGRMLAYLSRDMQTPPVITELMTPTGNLVQSPPDVLKCFVDYYRDLYSSHSTTTYLEAKSYLGTIPLPNLTPEQCSLLERPISCEEVQDAIASLKNGKSPGPDGLPGEFYKKFSEFLAPQLHDVFLKAKEIGSLPPSAYEATIIVIPKPGKDPNFCESYRPISLLQSDVKILAKILTTRLKQVILSLVHHDQTGFMPDKATFFSIRRLYTNIQATHDNVGTRVVVALDAAKAFDSVEWPYLWATLEAFGFGPDFIGWVKLLYHAPKARVSVNGWLSDEFPLYRGTRQGCPLSPLLYALSVEPLAQCIRSDSVLEGLRRGSFEERIGLYADDMILYLADPGKSLDRALSLIEGFGTYSGLRINWSKSHILPLDPFVRTSQQAESPLQWCSSIKYLGIDVSRYIPDFQTLNISPLADYVRSRTRAWARLPLSVIGRINLFKMILLPKILYITQQSPIYLPRAIFSKLNSILNSFVWREGRAKLAWSVMQNTWSQGGMAVPDIQLYYFAAQLGQVLHWGGLERSRITALLLDNLPPNVPDPRYAVFGRCQASHISRTQNFLWTQVQRIWSRILVHYDNPKVHEYTPLWHNSLLPEFRDLPDIGLWQECGVHYLGQIITSAGLKTFHSLKEEFSLPNNMLFRYIQMRHAFNSQFGRSGPEIPDFSIPAHLLNSNSKGIISLLYNCFLRYRSEAVVLRSRTKWETLVGAISDEDWEDALEAPTRVSLRYPERATQVYITHLAYLSTAQVAKYCPGRQDVCPKCNQASGTFYHLMWQCPLLQGFWAQVVRFLHDIMGSPIPLTPQCCVLGILDVPDVSGTQLTFLHETLFQARKLIARNWMNDHVPLLSEWIRIINASLPYKKLVYIHRGRPEKFDKIWSTWQESPRTL